VNNSISKRFADWPTSWPSDSFRSGPTIALLVIVILPLLAFGLWQMLQSGAVQIPKQELANPLVVIGSILLTLTVEGVLFLIVLVTLPKVAGLSLRQLGFRALSPRDLVVAFFGSLVMALVANGAASLIQSALHSTADQQSVAMLRQLHDPRLLFAFITFAVVLAPFMEETIFRAFLFNASRRYFGFWAGAAISGACFGFVHGDPIAALPLALGGVVLAFVYYRTNNIFASMITHGLFNSYTIIALLVFSPQVVK